MEVRMARYRVLTGLDYPPNKRAEIGDVVEDLPAQSIKWLLADGYIEDADKPKKVVAEEPAPAPVKKEAEFKPDAKDGDKDGFVQDGTEFERPVEVK
jgi:hypothetical protein